MAREIRIIKESRMYHEEEDILPEAWGEVPPKHVVGQAKMDELTSAHRIEERLEAFLESHPEWHERLIKAKKAALAKAESHGGVIMVGSLAAITLLAATTGGIIIHERHHKYKKK